MFIRFAIYLCAIICFAIVTGESFANEPGEGGDKPAIPAVLNHTMEKLGGDKVHLAKEYDGRVVLFVNVASECGLTPQYEQLQTLHKKYTKDGLAVVGIPCNQFGKQEPGSPKEIREFCSKKFGVQFDMLAKVNVNGDKACDLYKFLTSKETNGDLAGPILWNFEKFLVSRDGKVVARFNPKIKPDDEKVTEAIERELAKQRTK